MKILVLSNFYPPYAIGGYEMVCAEVVNWLVTRGVDVTVLTQRGAASSVAPRLSIKRRLFLSLPEADSSTAAFRRYLVRMCRDIVNYVSLVTLCRRWKPDLVFVFNPSGLGAPILEWLHRPRAKLPVVHDISDEWLLSAYQSDAWFGLARLKMWTNKKRLIRAVILRAGKLFLPSAPRPLALKHSYFRSAYLKERFIAAGHPQAVDAPIVHHGIRLGPAVLTDESPAEVRPRKESILFASRISREKGLDVLLRALPLLEDRSALLNVTVAGGGTDARYRQELDALLADLPENCRVHMAGHLSLSEVQHLLRTHSVFAFPVTWDEPFSLTILEAMNAGAAIVATATGGSKEILRHRENCLIVERDDPQSLAASIGLLLADSELRKRLGRKAQQEVQSFDLEKTFVSIGYHLRSVVGESAAAL